MKEPCESVRKNSDFLVLMRKNGDICTLWFAGLTANRVLTKKI